MLYFWHCPKPVLTMLFGFRVCVLLNGEVVAAVCRSRKSGRWIVTKHPTRYFDVEADAVAAVERMAQDRISFLAR